MKGERYVRCAAVIAVWPALLTGCASFPRHQLPAAGNLQRPPEGAKKPNAVYSFSSGMETFGKKEHRENIRTRLEKEFVDVLKGSGCFASISAGNHGELRIQVREVDSATPAAAIPAFFTGLTLYILPSWLTGHYNVTAKVVSPDGKERIYEFADSATTVSWLPMIVVAPFSPPESVAKELRRNIWQHLILKMQQDGLLPKSGSPGSTSGLDIKVDWKEAA